MVDTDPQRWIAAGGDPVQRGVLARAGRVAVFSEGGARCLAGVHPDADGWGAIGDWVGPPAVLRAAEAWLADQGCAEARGPMLLCPWLPHRASLGPHDAEPLLAEPTEPGSRWEAAGYDPFVQYLSILAPHDTNIRAGLDIAMGLASRGWSLQDLDLAAGYDASVAVVHQIACQAYPADPAIPADVLADFYRPWIPRIDASLSRVARTPDGEAAGYILAISPTDPDRIDRGWMEILDLAVLPDHRHMGIATWMVAAVHQAARRGGLTAGVHALAQLKEGLEDTTWFRGEVVRRYALFRKPL